MVTAQQVKDLREMTGAGMMDCKKALVETDGNIDEAVKWLRERGIAKAAKKIDRIAAEGVCSFAIDGNKAVVFEVNSETDFVAKNEKFLNLVERIGKALLSQNVNSDEEALNIEFEGETVANMLINATAQIGEKITLRRVSQYTKSDTQNFGAYSHMHGKIVAFTILEGGNEECAKDVCMHIAAMNPKYLNIESVDPAVIESEKEVFTQAALAEGKPANIVEKMVVGRVQKYLKENCLVNQLFVKDDSVTVEQFVASNGGKILSYVRLEVGEGIEKRHDDFAAEVAAAVAK